MKKFDGKKRKQKQKHLYTHIAHTNLSSCKPHGHHIIMMSVMATKILQYETIAILIETVQLFSMVCLTENKLEHLNLFFLLACLLADDL